ncbi:MAG TPA: NAD(P)-binding domain-containing protein [Bacteroidales bacterium]|nr:NAD(P)-binding domain-containing protein [Bacteroidales bacterium]
MRKSIGFIGGGKVTRLLLRGFDNKKIKFKKVIVADSNPVVLDSLRNEFSFIKSDSAAAAASQDIVFLGLDQKLTMDTLGLISNEFDENSILISTVPDINFAKLAIRLPENNRLARTLPPAAVYINEALIPVAFSPAFPEGAKDDVFELFNYLGRALEVPEEKLQTYSAFSSVLPAYFWYQWKELISMGRELGLNERETVDFLSESTISSLHLAHRSDLTEDQVIDILPVSPLDDDEDLIRDEYRSRLVELYRRVNPQRAEV